MERLIQCPDPSQNTWQIQYISKLRRKFGAINTMDSLTIYFCTMITNWMDTEMVIAEKFSLKYSRAIYSQYAIGWDNFFRGKISQEWILLYNESITNRDDTQRYSTQYIWGANIVKITLRQMKKLWDIRNKQVNGNTDSKRQQIMKNCQITKFKCLMLYKPDVQPSDLSFFPDNKEEFIEQSTAQKLCDYILMHSKMLANSKLQW